MSKHIAVNVLLITPMRTRLRALPDPEEAISEGLLLSLQKRAGQTVPLEELVGSLPLEIDTEEPDSQLALRAMAVEIICAMLSDADADRHRPTIIRLWEKADAVIPDDGDSDDDAHRDVYDFDDEEDDEDDEDDEEE